jgi:hypothetical protein
MMHHAPTLASSDTTSKAIVQKGTNCSLVEALSYILHHQKQFTEGNAQQWLKGIALSPLTHYHLSLQESPGVYA